MIWKNKLCHLKKFWYLPFPAACPTGSSGRKMFVRSSCEHGCGCEKPYRRPDPYHAVPPHAYRPLLTRLRCAAPLPRSPQSPRAPSRIVAPHSSLSPCSVFLRRIPAQATGSALHTLAQHPLSRHDSMNFFKISGSQELAEITAYMLDTGSDEDYPHRERGGRHPT